MEKVNVFQTSDYDASLWEESLSNWEETMVKNLQYLYRSLAKEMILSGLGAPRDPTGGREKLCGGEKDVWNTLHSLKPP